MYCEFRALLRCLGYTCELWPVKFAEDGKPVLGTGPYKVTDFERDDGIGRATLQHVHLGRHQNPHIIVAIHESDGAKGLQLVKNGEADVALNLEQVEDLDLIDFGPALQWGRVTSTLSAMLYLNCTHGLFRSEDARLAVNLAIDNRALVEEVYKGLALPSSTIVSPFHLGSTEANLNTIPFDPGRARNLLGALDGSTPLSYGPRPTCPSMRRRLLTSLLPHYAQSV